jgi:hypothetical protein
MGTSIFDPEQCNYPGIGQFYSEALDQAPPQEPPPLREQPARPEFPPEPVQPADQSDSVAMAEYFEELEIWRDQVEEIQGDYEADLQAYQQEAAAYQEALIAYQTELAQQQGTRLAAVQPAEASIEHLVTNFPWTLANKDDQAAFTTKILKGWIAQAVISTILFVGILIFQKRKDVN